MQQTRGGPSATDFSGADIMAPETGKQRQPALLEAPPPPAVRMRTVGDNDQTTAETDSIRFSGAASRGQLHGKLRVVDLPEAQRSKSPELDRRIDDELGRRLRRQDALVLAIGLMLLAVAAALTCLYWNYARPFPATDDAFIATRQIPRTGLQAARRMSAAVRLIGLDQG
jgi:hypothetical protein